MNHRLFNYLSLALTPSIGIKNFLKILNSFENYDILINLNKKELLNYVKKLTNSDKNIQYQKSEEIINFLEKNKNYKIITLLDKEYPISIVQNTTPSPFLFAVGNLELLKNNTIAIVGSRKPTPQSACIAKNFAQELSKLNITVVSGLAAGIDSYAHNGALQEIGSTIAIIGNGINVVYPKTNKDLSQEICQKGLLISEFNLNTPPYHFNFPKRNRIIAALTKAIIVIEANLKSGSLITANMAAQMGKDVMAMPGSILNKNAKGCHKLIKDGAKLIDCIEDIIYESFPEIKITSSESLKFNQNNILLLELMGYDPIHPDEIIQKINIDIDEIYKQLILLECDGYIQATYGGKFQRIK